MTRWRKPAFIKSVKAADRKVCGFFFGATFRAVGRPPPWALCAVASGRRTGEALAGRLFKYGYPRAMTQISRPEQTPAHALRADSLSTAQT